LGSKIRFWTFDSDSRPLAWKGRGCSQFDSTPYHAIQRGPRLRRARHPHRGGYSRSTPAASGVRAVWERHVPPRGRRSATTSTAAAPQTADHVQMRMAPAAMIHSSANTGKIGTRSEEKKKGDRREMARSQNSRAHRGSRWALDRALRVDAPSCRHSRYARVPVRIVYADATSIAENDTKECLRCPPRPVVKQTRIDQAIPTRRTRFPGGWEINAGREKARLINSADPD